MAENLGGIAILLEIVDKATPELEKFNKSLESSTATMGQKFKAFGTAVAAVGVAVAGAFTAMTVAALNFADEVGKSAQKAGVSTEDFSALAYAAKLSDVSMEQLTTGFQQLSKSMIASQDDTTKQAKAFEYLGVKTKDAQGNLKDSNTVFKEVSEAISKLPDGASKSAVAMDVFGKAGAQLIPLLNSGAAGLDEMRAEAEKLGLVLDENTTKAAEAFNDNMTRLKNGTIAFGLAIAKEVLPTLDLLAKSLLENAKNGEDFKAFASGIGQIFNFIVQVGATVVYTLNSIGKMFGAIAAAVALAAQGEFSAASNVMKMYYEDNKRMAASTVEFIREVGNTKPIEKAATEVKALGKAYKGADAAATAAKDALAKKYDDLLNQIQREIDGVKNLTFADQIRFEVAKGKYKDLTPLQKERVESLLKEADAMRLVNEATANLKKSQEDISKAQTQTSVDAQARLTDATNYLTILKTQGQAAADAWRAVNDAVKPLEAQRTVLQEWLDKAKAVGDTQGVTRYSAAITALNGQIETTKGQLQGVVDKTTEAARATQIWNQYIQSGRNELQLLKDASVQLEAAFNSGAISAAEFVKAMDDIRTKQESLTESSAWMTYIAASRNQIKQLTNDAGELTKMFNEGRITADEYAKALKIIDDTKFNLLKKELTDVQKMVEATAQGMQSDFSTFFFDAMNGKIDNLGQMFKKTLDRMVADMLASNLTDVLFGTMNTATGSRGSGGAMTTALNWLFGGLGKREGGGPVTAGVPYIVGEKRPEVFIPSVSGTIAPSVGAAMSGGGGTAVHFSITAMDSQDVMRSMEKIKRPLADLISGTNRAYNK
jgi:hypothetical protein